MKQILKTPNYSINAVLEYLMSTSGKMLRPRIVYLTASIYPHDLAVVRDTAVAVELIHMASLIHDDVIDKAMLRRGKPSVNSKWGNQVSVLAGDYLFASAFKLINQHNIPGVMDSITETVQIICSGEIKQLSMAYDLNITEEDYFEKCYSKTACLFASSCKVGALVSSMPLEEISRLEQFGLCLGYAYQIIDDVLDFLSSSDIVGKPVGNDLLQGNITLPVLIALRNPHQGGELRKILQGGNLNEESIKTIRQILQDTNALEKSILQSKAFLQRGIDLLNDFSPSPAVDNLKSLSIYLMEKYYSELGSNITLQEA